MLPPRGHAALFAALIVTSSVRVLAQADLEACEKQIALDRDGEAPVRCLYDLAKGSGPSRAAAAERLEELRASHPENAWLTHYSAHLKWLAGDGEAQEMYRRAAELARQQRMPRAELLARSALALMLMSSGHMDEAEREVERSAQVAESSRDPALRARAGILQASLCTSLGDLEGAYVILSRIGGTVEQAGSYPLTRDYLFPFNNVAHQTGRFAVAREGFRRLASLAAKERETASEAAALTGLIMVLVDERSEVPTPAGRDEVLALARQALAAARSTARPSLEARPLWVLGSLSDQAEAVRHLERCFDVASDLKMRSYCRGALARRLANDSPQAADRAILDTLTLARESGDILARTASWHERMRVSWEIRPREKALEDSRAALEAIESLRDQQKGSARQPGFFANWAEDYYWLSGRLLQDSDLERAFGVIERMRARTLIDALGLSRQRPAAPALHAQRADLLLGITQVQRRLLDASLGKRARKEARAELQKLEVEEEDLRSRIARADPDHAALRQLRFASLEQVRAALAPDEALLSFQIAPWKDLAGDFGGGSWLLVSTRRATQVYRLLDRTALRPKVVVFTGMFNDRNDSEAQAASALYGELVGSALAKLPPRVRRLVIVPDDLLHRLPFAALRPEPGAEPLATRYEITLAPSATLWLRWRESRPAPAVTPALVFADPVSLATVEGATERAASFISPARLGRLPYARSEGRAVVRHLGGGELLLGEDASETYLKRKGAGPFGLIHFAAHAVTDDVNPDRSGVHLSPGDGKEDGLLQVREIVELDLDRRIVVLSSCESASGEILRGEGVMGLARGFFQAGAHTVVASLWPLRDDEGAALFDRFYYHLGKGASVAAALQAAQRDRMEEGAPAAAWAGVVVLGDGDRVPVPGGRRNPGLVAGIALVTLLMVAGLLLRRRAAASAG